MEKELVLDNSVVMSWCFHNGDDSYVDAVLDRTTEFGAVVPSIWPLEVANVLLVAERRKLLQEADSFRFVRLLVKLPIRVDYQSPDNVLKDVLWLARTQGLSSYDASYLNLAMKKGLPLATLDKQLRKAVKAVSVKLFEAC